MIQILTGVPSDGLVDLVNEYSDEGATNLVRFPVGVLPDPAVPRPGIYLQSNGLWTVMALLPDPDGTPAPVAPPAPPTPAPSASPFPIPTGAADPGLTVESPSAFTIFTDLKQTVSTLTVTAIDDFFGNQHDETHRALAGIGQPVLDAQRKYGINATYIVAHAILESGWGTSHISQEKNNLFGWQAVDANPGQAKRFDSFAQCIDFVMGRVNALYLIHGEEWFVDRACVGNKQTGMNVHYAAEADWGTNIAAIAQHMGKVIDGAAPAPAPASKVRATSGRFLVTRTITGGPLPIPHGVFSLIADDGTVLQSIEANTGGFQKNFRRTNGPIPPGTYRISDYRSPRNDEGAAMRYFDVSFSFALTPVGTNVFGRSGLDIHPDGPPPGTHGCIGLVAQTADELRSFRDLLRAHTSGGSHLSVSVEYTASSGVV